MNHQGTIEIKTKRLILRRFVEADIPSVFKNWTSDDKVTEYLRWPTQKSIEETKNVIDNFIEKYKRNDFYSWAIVLKDRINEPIGMINVVDIKENLNIVQIGYCIGRKWWNLGIASEALSGIIPFLFEQAKANRIEGSHDPNNPSSGKVMEKCGFKYEGTLRQSDFNNKGIADAAVYSILACDYKNKNNKK